MELTNEEGGWIKLHRKSIHSQVFQSEGLWKLWTWCLMKANHKDQWVPVKTGRGTTEVFVKRGQFIFGRKTAAKELKMVERTVHKRMLKLATMRNCDIQSDSHYSIVTILNYDAYQSIPKEEMTPKVTGKGQASDTNKNVKNEKNNNIPVQAILETFSNLLPELPQIKKWTEERQSHLCARWNEDPKRQTLNWWRRYFEYVHNSSFLMGKNKEGWRADLEWLIEKRNLIKVIEGKYHTEKEDEMRFSEAKQTSKSFDELKGIYEQGGIE